MDLKAHQGSDLNHQEEVIKEIPFESLCGLSVISDNSQTDTNSLKHAISLKYANPSATDTFNDRQFVISACTAKDKNSLIDEL